MPKLAKALALLLSVLSPVVLPSPASAQDEVPDTTSAWRYFPLEVGNVWEYEGQDNLEGVRIDQRRTVTGDTLVDGVRYFRYEQQRVDTTGAPIGPVRAAYVRFDTLSTEFRLLEDGGGPYGVPYDFPFGVPFGSHHEYECGEAWVSGGYGQTVEIREDVVVTSVKVVDTGTCEYASTFAAGIGLVDYVALWGFLDLRYARIDGIEYGEAFAVVAEDGPGATELARLDVYPNPARGAMTVAYETTKPGRVTLTVTDVLGRTVAVVAQGLQPAGAHDATLDVSRLSPGLYVLRLEGPSGIRTRPLTVVR